MKKLFFTLFLILFFVTSSVGGVYLHLYNENKINKTWVSDREYLFKITDNFNVIFQEFVFLLINKDNKVCWILYYELENYLKDEVRISPFLFTFYFLDEEEKLLYKEEKIINVRLDRKTMSIRDIIDRNIYNDVRNIRIDIKYIFSEKKKESKKIETEKEKRDKIINNYFYF